MIPWRHPYLLYISPTMSRKRFGFGPYCACKRTCNTQSVSPQSQPAFKALQRTLNISTGLANTA